MKHEVFENDLIIRVLNGEEVERPPIWMMRQAGRILPQYRAVRAKLKNFKALVQNPEKAAEVTIQPVDELGVDAAILFSDILVIPEAMGLNYELIEKKGPFFPKTIESEADVDRLLSGDEAAAKLNYVYEGIQRTKEGLNSRVPLLGFSGAPWTLMCYMIEGQGSKTFSKAKKMLYANPDLSHKLLGKLTETIIAYLKLKIANGVSAVQIFDSWSGVLDRDLYSTFCIPYLQQIVDAIQEAPTIAFSRGAFYSMDDIVKLNSNVVGLDWTIDPAWARQRYGKDIIFQGNLDPCALYGSPKSIEVNTLKVLNKMGRQHIMNLGHGVYPDTNLENIKHFVNFVKSYRY